uniref:Uncharacterized protein n=2 Tax=Cyprinus carpio TaxID=7962 RepID=A0A8C1IKE9_CYPCA
LKVLWLLYPPLLKNKDNSKIKWEPKANQDNLYTFSMDNNSEVKYNIAIDKECKPCLVKIENTTCESSSQKAEKFLVNLDYFEDLEWKDYTSNKMPPFAVETCKGYIIGQNENKLGYIKKRLFSTDTNLKVDSNLKVLVQNYDDVKEEYLTNVQFNAELVQRNKKPDLFRNLTMVNNNCQVMKQQVKIDNSFEETTTYATGNTLLIGGSIGFKIKDIVDLGLKVDISATETETNSNIKKNDYGYIQDLEIPPRSSCTLVINSNILITNAPFTADLTRVYKNDEMRTTSINGTYSYEKSSEIKTNFEKCVKLPGDCLTSKPH